MCNLYSLSHRLQAILEMVAAMTKDIGNFGPMPGIFPDTSGPHNGRSARPAPPGQRRTAPCSAGCINCVLPCAMSCTRPR